MVVKDRYQELLWQLLCRTFTGRLPFLLANQQHKSTDGRLISVS